MEILSALWVVGGLASLVFGYGKKHKKELIQSVENMSKGTSLVGVQGSGKTMKAIIDNLDLLEKGYKFCWITTQGERQSKLIDYIPKEFKRDIELFAPYRDDSKGFNLLKCYTTTENERILRAKSVVIILDNMSENLSDNMKYCIYISTLAVLEYQVATRQEVTIYDAWQFMKYEAFREHIIKSISMPWIADDFKRFTDNTIDATNRRFGYLLSNSKLLNALCYTKDDSLDFQDMYNKIFICDFIEDNIHGLGTDQAIALAQAVVIQINILASTRDNDSPFYQIVCDEFYRYAEGIENIFRDFPDIHRQRRLGLFLIWQRFSQMSQPLVDIALSCVNKYFMQMQPEDDSTLSRKEMYKEYKGKFSSLKSREYIAFLNVGEGTGFVRDKTRDIGVRNTTNYAYVLGQCRSKYTKGDFVWWYQSHRGDSNVLKDGRLGGELLG